jgi:DNA (cytosine-5)-methyltransferase 1
MENPCNSPKTTTNPQPNNNRQCAFAPAPAKEALNELALFAGAGGGILGGHLLGWRTVCAVEIDSFAAGVLCARQNDGLLTPFPIWSSVCTFGGTLWRGLVDVVSGGFPCQDISNAGRGAGITGARSGLWSEFARIIREVEPPFVFVENSPMLASRGLHAVLGDLAAMGFDAEWCVLGADALGAPHHRERIWILAFHRQCAFAPARVGRWLRPNQRQAHSCVKLWEHETFDALLGACPSWPPDQPGAASIPHGMATWLDELKALGNGQVPSVAAAAWRILFARIVEGGIK